ncbi:hypothetical protein V2W45_1303966 [Cenococcum geophilum]
MTTLKTHQGDRTGLNKRVQGSSRLRKQHNKFPQDDAGIKSHATSWNRRYNRSRPARSTINHSIAPGPSSGAFFAKEPFSALEHETNKQPLTRGSSLPQAAPPTSVFRPLLATDPDRTAALWEIVRAANSSTMPPKRKNDEKGNGAVGNTQAKRGRDGLRSTGRGGSAGAHTGGTRGKQSVNNLKEQNTLQGTNVEELNEARTAPRSKLDLDILPDNLDSEGIHTDTRKSRIMVRSVNFEKNVLNPRKIVITGLKTEGRNPYTHFGTKGAPEGEVIDYKTVKGLDAAQIWLSIDDNSLEEIIEEYKYMDSTGLCEQEYALFAIDKFLRRQRRFREPPQDRKWHPERMVQLVAPPAGSHWAPPVSFTDSDSDYFKFGRWPDCSYWLSLAGFNSDYRGELVEAVYVHQDQITCPYFTIEFKKHNQSVDQATIQAATAAALALYNRFLLKSRALESTKGKWTESDMAQMRHYVLTFVGSQFDIWTLQANRSEVGNSWNGCTMRRQCTAKCISKSAVRLLENWINEIHQWGLSQHAISCGQDVKSILQANGVDVSTMELE